MLKVLLYICVSFFTLACYSQAVLSDTVVGDDQVLEDSNRTVTDFSYLVTQNSKVSLTWRVGGDLPDFFAIERSENGKNFEMVSVLNNLIVQPVYQWTDDAPKKGRNFYRIRYSFKQGPSLYSKTLSLSIAGYLSFKFYPNPVDHILIVRSDMPIDVQISDANGKIRITENRVRGLHTINVASLEKGIYLIRFSNKLTNVMSQEKLIKN